MRLCYCKPDSTSTIRVSRRDRDGMIAARSVDTSQLWNSPKILLHHLRGMEKQEECVENSAAPVEMPTETPRVFQTNQEFRRITSFRFSHIPDRSL